MNVLYSCTYRALAKWALRVLLLAALTAGVLAAQYRETIVHGRLRLVPGP